MITRRQFIAAGAGALVLAVPMRGLAQQKKIYHVAYLANDPDPRRYSQTFRGFVEGLQSLGWIEGKNIAILVKTSGGKDELFPQLVAEAIREHADVIVAGGSAATRAAKAATETLPIVFGSAANPVEQKFVVSLARPGGNVTGLALLVQELGPKRIELLKDLLPRAKSFARMYDANSISTVQPAIIKEDDAAARERGVSLRHMPVAHIGGLEAAFAAAARSRVDAVILTAAGLFVGNRERIAKLALEHRVPTMCADSRFTEAGALASYGENFVARYRRAAVMVDKVLRGTKPADIPVEQPAIFELVVNFRTARALGLRIPDTVLPDRVIR